MPILCKDNLNYQLLKSSRMAYVIHIKRWLEEAKEDFYTLFIKAWIPFNAWYDKEILPLASGETDRACINYICKHNNVYKDKILAYLRGNTRVDLRFQQEMVDLHLALLSHQIPDAASPINFKSITIFDDSHPVEESDFYSVHYKMERIARVGGGFDYDVKVSEKSTGALKFNQRFNRWEMTDLEGHADFSQFSDAIRKKLKEAFLAVYIKAPTNVIKEPVMRGGIESRPPHSVVYGREEKAFFINDEDKVSQVLIQLLYELRCLIFHGELDPKESSMEVYEHAYRLQMMLIKELS